MKESAYERLMMLLASDDLNDPCPRQAPESADVDEAVADAASMMADLAEGGTDWVGAAIWQQVAADARRAGGVVAGADPLPEPWMATDNEPEIYPRRRIT